MTNKAVKVRVLPAPQSDLSTFDPGDYLSNLEFYETEDPITEKERDGLAQFVHILAFLALQAQSSAWERSVVRRDTLAYQALESHFAHLDGWDQIAQHGGSIQYRTLAGFLMTPYPPRRPEGQRSEQPHAPD